VPSTLIASDPDVVAARQMGRTLALETGFEGSNLTFIATAISEIARNIVKHARRGKVTMKAISKGKKRGLLIVASDEGPGIPDIGAAMEDGFSTSQGLGLGLPGARRLMDEFEITSNPGQGTVVTMKKWLP
jgi:serine/threonine-protein kinase RsbT